jgi:hypothetical protein
MNYCNSKNKDIHRGLITLIYKFVSNIKDGKRCKLDKLRDFLLLKKVLGLRTKKIFFKHV